MLHPRWLLSLAAAAAFLGCSDSDPVPPGTNPTNKDASVSGDGGINGDGGVQPGTDGGPGADAGPMGPCDPVTGGNCDTGEVCYYTQGAVGDNVCRVPMGTPVAHEGACTLGTQDCMPGMHCVAFTGVNGGNPFCLKGCATSADCAGLMGVGMNGYECSLETQDMNVKLCVPSLMGCDPGNAASCANNETCEIGPMAPGCVPAGMVGRGMPCQPGQCQHGLACLNFGAGATCMETCNPMGGMCSGAGEVCAAFTVPGMMRTFGACQPGCDVFAQDCSMNRNCTLVSNTAVGCVTSGAVAIGGTCGQMAPCAQGGHCLDLGMGPTCYAACDMANPCAAGMCTMTNPPLPWGGICTM